MFARPIMIFYKILYPFIWALNGSARVLLRLFGMKPANEHEVSHTEEELRSLLSDSFKSGEINKNELQFVNNVFEFDDRIAREIMVPRTEIIGFEVTATLEDVLTTVSEERYTRYPIYENDRDNILGFLNIKDLLTKGLKNRVQEETFTLKDYVNPIINTIETTPIHDLLQKMQKERIHIAVLLDEYGGTSGIVTVEDILEEIVGDIRDEFDEDEIPEVRKLGEGHYILHSKVLLGDVEKLLYTKFDNEDVDTIGGWYFTQDIDLNIENTIEFDGYEYSIQEVEGHQLHYITVKKLNKPSKTEKTVEENN